ncbi:methyltransferase domain-containing protein [Streptacidiphilus sp. N1-10]|uniref:Methyltransferase domain-containing protein n=1 Tax=Streptacidiphilus jeojiensis TaxID=3229225 RepID=A0ABV6XQQ2_9ACTN
MSRYVFDSSAVQAPDRFTALETCYDPVSRLRIAQTGLGAGWHCLEVGGGGGSLGTWLADVVGPLGQVLLTDLVPQPRGPQDEPTNLTVMQHDIVSDDLPQNAFDLVHARLVLLHLPQRRQVLDRLVAALRPGGWLVLEEFDCGWVPVLTAPHPGAAELFEKVHAHLMRLLSEAGADPLWGRRVYGAMSQAGLTDLSSSTHAEAWAGGGAGIRLHRVNTEQVEDRLLAGGVTAAELRDFWSLLDEPGFAVNSYPLVTVRGRRPHQRDD